MRSNITKLASLILALSIVILEVHGRRSLRYKSSDELVSDGVHQADESSSLLLLKGMDSGEECEQLYGFLPCSNSMLGHLFLIVVYEYLLFKGESLVAAGGEQIFKILGPGIFGASAFHVLGALPESLILLGNLFPSHPFLFSFIYLFINIFKFMSTHFYLLFYIFLLLPIKFIV